MAFQRKATLMHQRPALTPLRWIVAGFALVALVGGLAHAGSQDIIKEHISKLADADGQARERAVLGLWDVASTGQGVELALPAIIGAVTDDDPRVRGLACHSLLIAGNAVPGAYIGELRSAIYPLTKALSDKDRSVRDQAVQALASVAGRLSKEGDVVALLPVSYAVDRLREVSDQDAEFKKHAGTLRRSCEMLQERADELAGRAKTH